jgi:hypothetical protein
MERFASGVREGNRKICAPASDFESGPPLLWLETIGRSAVAQVIPVEVLPCYQRTRSRVERPPDPFQIKRWVGWRKRLLHILVFRIVTTVMFKTY